MKPTRMKPTPTKAALANRIVDLFLAVLMLTVLPVSQVCAWQVSEKPQTIRRVKRAARPALDQGSSADIFFKDVYAEGTVGERPDVSALNASVAKIGSASSDGDTAGGDDVWSKIIDASVIEDEVKTLQQEINLLVTTPVMFQTKYNDVNERFEVLSMLFAIIRQYDGDIRWVKYAPTAQVLFQKAAVASRNGAVKGFQYCKARKEDLQELVRGGSIVANELVPESIDWSVAANRTPIMIRLESANEQLKRMTSSAAEFKANTEGVFRLSNLVAAMSKVITQEGMPEAEEDSYGEFSQQMKSAALELKSAVKLNDFDLASSAANAISQSCADCHSEWR